MQLNLKPADFVSFERELCSRSLAEFVRLAWPVLEPGQPYIHGWHIDAICEHLEAVAQGEIRRLIINVPPGTMKSMLVGVFWPAWLWGPFGFASSRILGFSHEARLATRDSRRTRSLIASDWYQELWPIRFVTDQNEKTYFENDQTGWRQALASTSLTGRRGDFLLFDDPHSVKGALSDADRQEVLTTVEESLPTRLNVPEKSAILFIMQRLHEEDASGFLLSRSLGYEHLCLPMEFEPDRKCYTSIGFEDPRTKDGELLFPERFPRETVEEYKRAMGAYAYAGQMQQRPAPRAGAFFEWDKIEILDVAPTPGAQVRYWDKAGTEGGGARTAGVLMGRARDGSFVIYDVTKGQWAAPKREAVMKQTADVDGQRVKVRIEQEPGSGGKESAEATVRNLAGYSVTVDRVTGDKATRAEPFAVQMAAGNIKLARGDWNKDFIDELKTFPVGKFKDQVDAAAGAFNALAVPSKSGFVVI
jgi:predicted phage terminase large subunit-like protein